MAGARLAIEVNTYPVAKALAALLARSGDLTPVMEQIGRYFETRTAERFEHERGPGDVAWPKSLRAKLQNGQTLTDTARLRKSITSRATPSSVAVGTNVIYAAIHQFGGTISARSARGLHFVLPGGQHVNVQKVNIPARPFLGIDGTDREEISRIIARDLAKVSGVLQ